MIVLSSFAIAAYSCSFENAMEKRPVTYMLSLLYFRGPECSRNIKWHSLGVFSPNLEAVKLPEVSAATSRTFTLSILYLIINVLLVMTSIVLLCKWQ